MNKATFAWSVVFLSVLLWSGWKPHDYPIWWLEVAPALAAAAVLLASRKRFPLTPLLYILVLIHSIILMIGGHYTYAEVPIGDWWREFSGGSRNDYDKLGHLAQGFIPAIAAREILIRFRVLSGKSWLAFLVVCVCLAISAFYELVEWWVALLSSQAAESFLGTQGYVWDTQSDMFMALIGAGLALLTLSRLHDRQLASLHS